MPLLRFAEAAIDTSDAGVAARRLVNAAMGSKQMTMGISIFEPGAGIFLHTHPCEEIVVILAGEAMAEIDGQIAAVGTFDVSFVPPGVPHRFWNGSDRPMTMLYCYPMTAGLTRDPVDPAAVQGRTTAHY